MSYVRSIRDLILNQLAIEKGIRIGKAEGKAEEQRQIAANLKKQGVNIAIIAQCTGLSVEEIDRL